MPEAKPEAKKDEESRNLDRPRAMEPPKAAPKPVARDDADDPRKQPSAPPRPPAPDPAPSRESTVTHKGITVSTTGHWICTAKPSQQDSVSATTEPRGARIAIAGQGPCAGEIREWSAVKHEDRIDVTGTYGTKARCRCDGSGEMLLRGIDPGSYEVHVNGGFDRPIVARINVQ